MQNKNSSVEKLKLQALSILQMSHSFPNSNDFALIPSRINLDVVGENQIEMNNEENVKEQEFSFACFDAHETFIFADEIFENGKIRPTSATFHQSLVFTTLHDKNNLHVQPPLKKLFVVEEQNNFLSQSKGIAKRSCNEISQKMEMHKVEALNNQCNKSKSTSFSKTRRFRESLKLRSYSANKDVFVLFNSLGSVSTRSNDKEKQECVVSKKEKDQKCKMTLSPHKKQMNKKKETSKHKSFLPYKKNLIGFFTNMNGFSKHFTPY